MTPADPKPEVPARDPLPAPLKRFIWDIQSMVELADSEREILMIGRDLMERLLAGNDWLPAAFVAPDGAGGRQFQIYSDNLERFTVVSTVLPPGTGLSIDQPSVWEIAGVVRGTVTRRNGDGEARALPHGTVETRSSKSGDTLRLHNAAEDGLAISIHVYGGEISRLCRRAHAPNGATEAPSSNYANTEDAPPYDILSIQTRIVD